jgi:hypothetical protein
MAEESGELSLRYPVYAVLSAEADDEEGLVVVEVDGGDCLPLFRSREVAELYLEQVQAPGAEAPLTLQECRGDEELEHLLTQLPDSVAAVVWDAMPRARAVMVTPVRDLLAAVRGDAEGEE